MQKILNTDEAIQLLLADEHAAWSRDGARAIVEYLEQVEEDTDKGITFDRVAIRCDYSEYKGAWDAMEQYQPEDMPTVESDGMGLIELQEAQEAAALEWLQDRTTVIPFDGRITLQGGQVLGTAGVIIANF